MSATPTKNGIKRTELLSRIYTMFRPLVENLVGPLILRELANSPQPTEEQKQEFVALPEDGLTPEAKKRFREWKQEVLNLRPLTSKEMEEEVSGAVSEELEILVGAWVQTFVCGQPACDGWHYIQVNTIDDAMLPPLNKEIREAFQEQFMNTILDESQVLAILRQLRASLPAGKVLPDELIELLALSFWSVKIV